MEAGAAQYVPEAASAGMVFEAEVAPFRLVSPAIAERLSASRSLA